MLVMKRIRGLRKSWLQNLPSQRRCYIREKGQRSRALMEWRIRRDEAFRCRGEN